MSTVHCLFDFDTYFSIICFAGMYEYKNTDNDYTFKITFPLLKDNPNNIIEKIFNKILCNETFNFDTYDENNVGKRFSEALFESVVISIKAGDTFDIELAFKAKNKGEVAPSFKGDFPDKEVVFPSRDCVLSFTDDCGESINGDHIISLTLYLKKDISEIYGKIRMINNFLHNSGPTPIHVIKRCKGNSFFKLGYKEEKNDTKWIVSLKEVMCEIPAREINDGLDMVDINFKGKKE